METSQYLDNTPTQSWGQRLLNFMKNSNKEQVISPAEKSTQFQNFQAIGITNETREILVNKADCLREITKEGQAFLKLGINDGISGLRPNHIDGIAKTNAVILQTNLEGWFRQQHTIASKTIERGEKTLLRISDQLDKLDRLKSTLDEHYRFNRKDYSKRVGLLYILIAFILVAADLPLSYSVARESFELKGKIDPYLFAFGIALMTIFVKIIYDQYLGMSIQEFLLRRRPNIIMGNEYEATEIENKKARFVYNVQLLAQVIILLFILSTIFVVGYFRLENDAAISSADEILKGLKSDADPFTTGSTWKKLSFIGITMAFPIISGVCASVGFKHFNNVNSLKKINAQLKKQEQLEIDMSNQLLKAEGEVAEYNILAEWVSDRNEFIQEQETYFLSCYKHGYKEGVHQKVPTDLFEAAIYSQLNYLTQKSADLFSI